MLGSLQIESEAMAGFFEGDGFDFAGIDVGHAALDFLVPGGFDEGIVGFVEAFDEGAGEVRTLRDGKGKSFLQKVCYFLGHALILPRKVVGCGVVKAMIQLQDPGSRIEPGAPGAPDNNKLLLGIERCVEGMRSSQVAAIIEKYVRDHPERWDWDLKDAGYSALLEGCRNR